MKSYGLTRSGSIGPAQVLLKAQRGKPDRSGAFLGFERRGKLQKGGASHSERRFGEPARFEPSRMPLFLRILQT